MSYEDSMKTIEKVYSVGDARNIQFGKDFTYNMTYRYNQAEWFELQTSRKRDCELPH